MDVIIIYSAFFHIITRSRQGFTVRYITLGFGVSYLYSGNLYKSQLLLTCDMKMNAQIEQKKDSAVVT